MAEVSFVSLPVETIHRIFDFLDFQTILFSVRSVCKRFQETVNLYNRLYVSLTPKQKKIFKPLLGILPRENITGLSLTQMFCSSFPIQQFTRISSLSLREIRDKELEQILQNLNTNHLTSLFIESSENKHINTWKLISTVIQQANIKNLYVPNMNYTIEHLSWPVQYNLQKLVFHSCTFAEYFIILDQLPFLRTLLMDDCIREKADGGLSTLDPKRLHTSLKSLTINRGSFSSSNFDLLLEPIPELCHLKLITNTYRKFDSMFDGNHWQQIVQTNLSHLNKLEMCISCHNGNDDDDHKIESIVATFATPFWLNEKRWIVCCSRTLDSSYTMLYTMPVEIKRGKTFRYEVSAIDPTCRLTSRNFNATIDDVSIETTGEVFLRRELIGWKGAKYLSVILQRNTMITKLDLGQNSLEEKGVQYLTDALCQNTTLTTLCLYDNKIRDGGIKFITKALIENKTLMSLDLAENDIREIGMEYLSNALQQNTTLTKLDLGRNNIGDTGAKYLADVLKSNSRITELNLTTNKIKENGARDIADGLKQNKILSKLSLGNNAIGQAGAKYLAESLLENKTLIILELCSNNIGNQGAKYLTDILSQNTALTTLDLQHNQIDDNGARFLIEALTQNQTIQVMTLYGNLISSKVKSNLPNGNDRIRC